MDTSRLDHCGWSSFDPELFFGEPGRRSRQIGPAILKIIQTYSPGRTVLELCCGGGALAIFLAEAGCRITAIDLSESMLETFRQTLADKDKTIRDRIRILCGDVCTFDIGRQFDFIIFEDDGFGYLLTEEDQIACLSRIVRHLAPGGRFLLANKTPAIEFSEPGEYDYDPTTRIISRPHIWTTVDANGASKTVRMGGERRRVVESAELLSLLDRVGLKVLHQWGDLEQTPFHQAEMPEYILLMEASAPPLKQAAGIAQD